LKLVEDLEEEVFEIEEQIEKAKLDSTYSSFGISKRFRVFQKKS